MDDHSGYLHGFDRQIFYYLHAHACSFRGFRRLPLYGLPEGIFSDVGKWFGMQDLEIGDEAFDRDFILKSNQESKLRELLGDAKIQELICQQPQVYFAVKDDEGFFGSSFPGGVDELYFQVVGVIKDVERLKLLYTLFAETLDQLCRIGSANESAAKVNL